MDKTFSSKPAHPYFQFLGGRIAEFKVESDRVLVTTDRHKIAIIDTFRIGKLVLRKGLLFSTILIPILDEGNLRLSWLSKKQAVKSHKWLLAHLFDIYSPFVVQDASHIKQCIANCYLREQKFKSLRKMAQQRVLEFADSPKSLNLKPSILESCEFLMDFAFWSTEQLSKIRQEYISSCRESFKAWFDSIESNPLTSSQRNACIIDEQNNLVLAGAGTGKTSTMVGRVAFLLQSGQADPREILMLAFAKKAAEEMQDRVRDKLDGPPILVSTFHKLGKNIVAKVENGQPSISPLAEDDALLLKRVDGWLDNHMQENWYRSLLLSYFSKFLYPSANPFEFESEGEYFDFIIANGIRTLKGEPVKGIGECLIANHLFKQGIEYEYEPAYEHATRNLDFRQYQPDFYLPEYGIYIEHFGIARDGSTAPYVDRAAYHEGMEWKRGIHKEHGTTLVETYFYEHMEGTLLVELERKLVEHDVKFDALPSESILETLREFGAVRKFTELLTSLLRSYRSRHFKENELEAVIKRSKDPEQMQAVVELLNPIISDYEQHLLNQQQVDFDDMIGMALSYVCKGRYVPKWKYILVDEFQDISSSRARLLLALRDASEDCSLFCVGDDWQAIYRFAGSDISYTTKFRERFGPTATTALDLTFRFNNSISEVAERFILENPAQVKKHMETRQKVSEPAVSLLRADNREGSEYGKTDARLVQVLKRISGATTESATVFLLHRYKYGLPEKIELVALNDMFEKLKIEASTIHGSKGNEADYVILLGLETGEYGFPSQKTTNPLLEALLPPAESFSYAEERRLFYVAITRARARVYLITDMSVASDFVVELLNKKYPIELNEFETSIAQELFQKIRCRQCKTGTLVQRESKHGVFYGCSHFPLCKYAESGCKNCSGPMERIGRFKVCLKVDCQTSIPVCPLCGGEMQLRNGKYGEFWGCRNFRGDEPVSCKHTEPDIDMEALEESN